jgi:hypothetical protein
MMFIEYMTNSSRFKSISISRDTVGENKCRIGQIFEYSKLQNSTSTGFSARGGVLVRRYKGRDSHICGYIDIIIVEIFSIKEIRYIVQQENRSYHDLRITILNYISLVSRNIHAIFTSASLLLPFSICTAYLM